MSEQEVAGRLRLVRFGGILITAMVFGVLIAFSLVFNSSVPDFPFGTMLLWTIGFTLFAAVVSVALYFGYRAMLRRGATKS